ncbi:MAG: hypothetical protein ACTMH4_09730 [Sphingobacterium sp.]
MKKKVKYNTPEPVQERKIDQIFRMMDQRYVAGSLFFYFVNVALIFFGVMGLIWMIPFPQFDFLVSMEMHTFLNWGSFYIAIVIYLYLRMAPTLSYLILFTIGAMSFLIVQLEYLERDGGPQVWLVSLVSVLAGLTGVYLNSRKESPVLSWKEMGTLITIGPIWCCSKVFKKFNMKY